MLTNTKSQVLIGVFKPFIYHQSYQTFGQTFVFNNLFCLS